MAGHHSSEEEPLVGVPMSERDFERLISDETARKYELIDEMLFDTTGGTPQHNYLAGQIDFLFHSQLGRSGPCRTHRNQYAVIPGHHPVCPDLVLTCDLRDWQREDQAKPFCIQSPLIVVEVLSPGKESYDRVGKFERYQKCPTLEVYMLVSQSQRQIEVYRRQKHWQQELFTNGQAIHLDQLDLELEVDEIYEGIL